MVDDDNIEKNLRMTTTKGKEARIREKTRNERVEEQKNSVSSFTQDI